ncbi:MAG: hypothetical protein ACR652_25085 [Methylocystis sp.]|uniref:hypothetical protein n=1 Tax=Methylocystis sp. TaxID=1911079 RepID=UPI003DA64DB4
MALTNQIVGNVGMYFVCYKLSLLGWNAMPTARNAKGIDVIAYSPDGKNFRGIQVKAQTGCDNVPLKRSLDDLMGDLWVIVTNAPSDAPVCYILTPDEVKAGAKCYNQDHWLQKAAFLRDEFRERWDRLTV